MIEKLSAPDHVAAFRLSGTLTEEDVEQVIADVDARLTRHDRIGIMADLTAFHDVGLRAAIRDLRYSFGKIFEWRRVPREAIVTDRKWVLTMAAIAGPLIPFVKVRCFGSTKRDAALAWAADIDGAIPVA